MKKHLETLLLCLAYGLLFPLLWINKRIVRNTYGSTVGYDFSIAYQLDVFANHILAPLWNYYLLAPTSSHHFGHERESLSSVLGKNQRDNTLTVFGDKLRRIIDSVDRSVKNHCLYWIAYDINYQHEDFKLIKKCK